MPKNYKIITLDFQEKTVKFNPLQAWRDALQADLEAKELYDVCARNVFPRRTSR